MIVWLSPQMTRCTLPFVVTRSHLVGQTSEKQVSGITLAHHGGELAGALRTYGRVAMTNARGGAGQFSRRRALCGGLAVAGGTLAVGYRLPACSPNSPRRDGPHRFAAAAGADRRGAPEYGTSEDRRPIALVYRGPATIPGCPEAVAALIRETAWNFDVRYVGPGEPVKLSAAALREAALYAQPGGGELDDGYRHMRPHAADIRGYVAGGGRYLGFCLGGYLAGATPGFGLLPGDADRFIATPGASVRTDGDVIVEVRWRNRPRRLYFQDGPYFWSRKGASGVTVLARYTNGRIAALVAPHAHGRIGVVGPHPEATADWYEENGLVNSDGIDPAPGRDLINTLMRA
jgi:glutamine amidotransferase-like uncharacterized protein